MKKNTLNILLLFSIFICNTSCNKKFLDEPSPENGDLSENIIFSTKSGAINALTGVYDIFREENYNGYGGPSSGAGYLTNRGLQTTMFHFEMKMDDLFDVYAGTYYWGQEGNWGNDYYFRSASSPRSRQIWDMFYKAINNANAIIKNVDQVIDASQIEKKQLIAEAKAIRAYSYFWLVRAFQYAYSKNPDAPGVPIYLEPASAASTGNPRSSLREVYSVISTDIEDAIADLTNVRDAKYRINKNVAEAMAAQIYQEMAMVDKTLWDKVIKYASEAVVGYPLMSNTQFAAGFNDLSNPEWIWGFPVPSDQSLTYYSIYSYVDQTNGYYKNVWANRSLYNFYSSTDTRKKTLATYYSSGPYNVYTKKFTSRTAGVMEGDILAIRSAQLLLIEAEAYAQKEDVSSAINKLYELQVLRDPSAIKPLSTLTKDDIINLILKERRKEMYGENGGIFFDYKRLGKVFERTGNHTLPVSVTADDVRWVMRIPTKEIESNLALTDSDQNP